MNTRRRSLFVLSIMVLSVSAAWAQTAARTIEITANDTMKYTVAEITAKPGEQLRVKLSSSGAMPKIAMSHNFVLLKKAADAAAFANAALQARATEYIPADMKGQIVASTTLIGNGESAEVTFKVPAAPGQYPFLCTFPGHFAAGMKGVLIVK